MSQALEAADATAFDLIDIHQRAGRATRRFLLGIASHQWAASTNCAMDVRALVNHLVTGHEWAALLACGKTIAEVGVTLDGDILGSDPLAAYDAALGRAVAAFDRPGALEQVCHLSYGDVPLAVYCSHRILDTFIHGWDLARATGQDDTLDAELVQLTYRMFRPHAAAIQGSGAFGTPVSVAQDADMQTRLLGMLGRDNRR